MNELLLGNFELAEAKRLQVVMEEKGITLSIRAHDQTCNTKNCKITVELWAEEKDLNVLKEYFRQEFFKNLDGHDINLEAMNSVFDPSAEFVVCQACSAKFSPKATECPDCGLCY